MRRLAVLLVAAAYFFAGRLGLMAGSRSGLVSVLSPAAGVGVAGVLLGGRRMLAAVAAGSLACWLSYGESVPVALVATAAAACEPLVASAALRRVGFRAPLTRVPDVAGFVGVAALGSTLVGATVAALGLLALGRISGPGFGWVWRDWWVGDFGGVLIIGSALLVCGSGAGARPPSRRTVITSVTMTLVVALLSLEALAAAGPLPYLVLPMLFVLAFAYRQPGAVLGGAVISVVATVLTLRGHGPFAGGPHDYALIRALTFVSVGSLTALLVAAAQSERRLAERAVDRLAESERALAEAQRLARLGSFDMDLETGRTRWSDELYRILGYGPGELPPTWESWLRCVHADDQATVEDAIATAVREHRAISNVHRVVRADGQIRTVDTRLRVEDQQGLRAVGTTQDITTLKLAEDRFRSLFESAPYPIVVVEESGRIVLSNRRVQQMFGFAPGELEGRWVEELIPSPQDSVGPWLTAAIASAVSAPPEADAGIELELLGRRRDGEDFPVEVSLTPLRAEEGTLASLAIRDVTEVRAAAAALSFQARHDALTGLPNRTLFLERLEQALSRASRNGRPLAVVFLDLDDFKLVNDRFGHEAGDTVLRALTPRLSAAVRLGDTVARLGGDEFVALCEDLTTEADAVEIAERLVGAARRGLPVGRYEHTVSISAGVVIVSDAGSVSVSGLVRDADAAMYAAKAAGKGHVAVFDESMRERLLERVAIESALRGAQDRGELELAYQPVVELASRRTVAVEALLRWRHPVRGMLAPRDFIAVAESTGLIAGIGEWVIGEACRQAARWREMAGPAAAVPVAVNVSSHQLTRTDLTGAVARCLQMTGLPAGLLQLEVTESALLDDMAGSRHELHRLKELGVRLVVDDFGTGYSSLSVLRDLMIDGLKLDPSFVSALGQAGGSDGGAIVDALLGMGDALDAAVTAEGVETWAQARDLRRHGCGYAQGYLFGRPGPPEQVTALIGCGRGERRSRHPAAS